MLAAAALRLFRTEVSTLVRYFYSWHAKSKLLQGNALD